MLKEGQTKSNKEAIQMAKKKEKKDNGKQPKAEQAARREALFAKHEKVIREHFAKDGAKVSELKKALGFKDEKSYQDLLWCRDRIAEKK